MRNIHRRRVSTVFVKWLLLFFLSVLLLAMILGYNVYVDFAESTLGSLSYKTLVEIRGEFLKRVVFPSVGALLGGGILWLFLKRARKP